MNWPTRLAAATLLGFIASALTAYALHYLSDQIWVHGYFIACFAAAFICYGLASWLLIRANAPLKWTIAVIFIVAVPIRLIFTMQPPVLSGDIARYVWDGMLQANGINPFRFTPDDPSLEYLHDSWAYQNMGFYSLYTPYLSTSQLFYGLSYMIGGSSLTVMKLGLVLADLLAIVVLLWITVKSGKGAALVALYAWHPLLILEVAHSGHVDGLVLPLVVISLAFTLRNRPAFSGIFLGIAILVKPYLIILAPAFWKPWEWRFPVAIVGALLAGLLVYAGPNLELLFNGKVLGSSFYLASEAQYNAGFIWTSMRGIGERIGWDAESTIRILGVLILMAAGLWAGFGQRRNKAITPFYLAEDIAKRSWVMIAAFWLTTQQIHPWYLVFGLPFLALYMQRWAFIFSLTVMVAYMTYYYDPWFFPEWLRALEYVPVYLLLVWELPRLLKFRSKPISIKDGGQQAET